MDDKTKRDFILLFNQGFEEVVLPQIKEIYKRLDLIEDRLDKLEKRIETLEIRIGQIDNKLDLMNDKLLDHAQQIKTIQAVPAIAHQIKK